MHCATVLISLTHRRVHPHVSFGSYILVLLHPCFPLSLPISGIVPCTHIIGYSSRQCALGSPVFSLHNTKVSIVFSVRTGRGVQGRGAVFGVMSAFSKYPRSARLLLLSWQLTRLCAFPASQLAFTRHTPEQHKPYLHRQWADARTRTRLRKRKVYEQRLQYAPAAVRHN